MKTLYLIDGYSLIYRSYFAFIHRPLTNRKGENTSAVFGFFKSLFSFISQYKPELLGVILDSIGPTFRHVKYPEYKANREKTPEDLHAQIPVIETLLKAFGIAYVRLNGFEADDIIATYGKLCLKEGRPCRILSGDKDLLQLVEGPVRVLQPGKSGGFSLLGREEVFSSWGVYPEQIVDYLSLTGDQSDNVPGVKGIGPKTAEALITKFGTLTELYEKLPEITGSQRTKLEENKENAFLSRDLITLRADAPIPEASEGDFTATLALRGLNADLAIPLLKEQDLNSLITDLAKPELAALVRSDKGPLQGTMSFGETTEPGEMSAVSPGSVPPKPAASVPAQPAVFAVEPKPRGSYDSVTTLARLQDWIKKVKKAGIYAFDSETDSIEGVRAKPVGFSLSVEAGKGCYIPLRASGREVLREEGVRELLRQILEDPGLKLIGQNIKYDYQVLKNWGIVMRGIHFDTMVAGWVLDTSAASYGMDNMAERYLSYETIHFTDIVPKGDTFDLVPLEQAVEYAAEDADITYRLYELFAPQIEARGFQKLFYEVEMPLVPILGDMELAGVKLLPKKLTSYSKELEDQLADIEKKIFNLCGFTFNIKSTKELQEVLFVKRKLKTGKRTKTGFSTDTGVLEELAREDPVPGLVLEHRLLAKLKSTYVDALPGLINPKTGRVHSHFLQTGTATGRLSSRDPNLQNIPIKTEEGRKIRSAFTAEKGNVLISADYSQIELVVLAHLSGDKALCDAFESGSDVHSQTASLIFGVPVREVTQDQRRAAKVINFGIMYGMSAFRLAGELSIPRTTAAGFIETYFNKYSGITSFIADTVARTEESGNVSTILGRERKVPGINSRNKTEKMAAERVAVNTPIQGSAADIVKLSMLRVSSELRKTLPEVRLILQVHDELIFEAPKQAEAEAAAIIRREMEKAMTLNIPLKVSIESGTDWGDLH